MTNTRRIASLDGLRAVAVLGVIWCHVFFFLPNRPTLLVGGIDINRSAGFGATGVDLFFVISGFCLYLMYSKVMEQFRLSGYLNFVKKRWLRIAPAFYVAVLASALFYYLLNNEFLLSSVLKHFLFLNTIPPQANNLASPFWSLATEWQFYLILPLLFLFPVKSRGFGFWIAFLYFLSLAFRFYIYQFDPASENLWKSSIIFRLPEFIAGIYVAHIFLKGTRLPRFLNGTIGFLTGAILAFSGRTIMGNVSYVHFSQLEGIGKTLGEPILTIGYALIVWNVIASPIFFISKLLQSRPMLFIGKISYSMYLWHWWLLKFTVDIVSTWFSSYNVVLFTSFLLFLILFIPFSYLSYVLLESFYFKLKSNNKTVLTEQQGSWA